jgi:hypothetical protein
MKCHEADDPLPFFGISIRELEAFRLSLLETASQSHVKVVTPMTEEILRFFELNASHHNRYVMVAFAVSDTNFLACWLVFIHLLLRNAIAV